MSSPVDAGSPRPTPGPTAGPALLVVRGVRRSFGGQVAVDVDALDVDAGSIVAVIGPNGAGKSTLFNIITGFEPADGGSWSVDGRQLEGRSAERIAASGVVRTFQTPRVLERLTVLENLQIAAPRHPGERLAAAALRRRWQRSEADIADRAANVLDRVGLAHHATERAAILSGGERKLLELGRVLMTDAPILLLDEPLAGVNPTLALRVLECLDEVRREGRAILFVEHDLAAVASLSDHVVCMAGGRVIARGSASDVAADPAVVAAYLGHRRANG